MTKKDVDGITPIDRGGRPSGLTEELIAKAQLYLLGGYVDAGDAVPSVAGLACWLGKGRSSMYEYAKQDDRFSDTLEGILAVQEKLLITGGLTAGFNATITKLMMANHGYAEKVETDTKSSDGSMTPKPAMSMDQFRDVAKEIIGKV